MGRRYILANTLTWHFIYFAKLMGFYTKIRTLFHKVCNDHNEMLDYYHKNARLDFGSDYEYMSLFQKDSFKNYINQSLIQGHIRLTKQFILNTYFLGIHRYRYFREEELDELIDLFFSYLKDKKIYKYIRIDRS